MIRRCSLGTVCLAAMVFILLVMTSASTAHPLFDADYAYSIIAKLASPEFEGRLTGSDGNRKAMQFIAAEFKKLGLQAFSNTGDYFQPFDAYVPQLKSVPVLEVLSNGIPVKKYVQYQDFRETWAGLSRPGEVTGGAGAYNSLYDVPASPPPVYLYDKHNYDSGHEYTLYSMGIRGVIFTVDDYLVKLKGGSVFTNEPGDPEGFVKLVVTPGVMDELKDFAKKGCVIHMKSDFSMQWVKTANVAGYLPGADQGNLEIISCHLDHMGKNPDGSFYPGALDNASGVGVMLSLAKVLAENKGKLAKSFLFVAFNSEEQGLGGSFSFIGKSPLMPQNAEVLNFDMVGSKENVGLELYSAVASALEDSDNPIVARPEELIAEIAKKEGLSVSFNRNEYSSDHLAFAYYAIPAMTFSQYATGNYHTVRDTIDNIDKERLRQVGQLALDYLNHTAFIHRHLFGKGGVFSTVASILLIIFLGMIALVIVRARWKKRALPAASANAVPSTDRVIFLKSRRMIVSCQAIIGIIVFALFLGIAGGLFSCEPSMGKGDMKAFTERYDRYLDILTEGSNSLRPLFSPANGSTVEFVSETFGKLGFEKYFPDMGDKKGNYKLVTRAMLPVSKSAPVLRLVASDGSLIREFVRGRDFIETTAGNGGGGKTVGAYRLVTSAYDAYGASCPAYLIRAKDFYAEDEDIFAKRGAKVLLIEGDPNQPIPTDYSDGKSVQLLADETYLRFIVTPEAMDAFVAAMNRGASVSASWDVTFKWVYPESVVGYIPAKSDDKVKSLVITAPLDTKPGNTGSADGSRALAFLLAFAETMKEKGFTPKIPIVFIASNGAFEGHLGARSYCISPAEFKSLKKPNMWVQEISDPLGVAVKYEERNNLKVSNLISGIHLVNLAEGAEKDPVIFDAPSYPVFVPTGAFMATELEKYSQRYKINMNVVSDVADFDHTWYYEKKRSPALTLQLPGSGSYGAVAAVLSRFVHHETVSVLLSQEQWGDNIAGALLFGLIVSLLAGWIMRLVYDNRKVRGMNEYDVFLRKLGEKGEKGNNQ